MKLKAYIRSKSAEMSDTKNTDACLRSIGAYIGTDDIDLLATLKPGWIDGYARFLADGYSQYTRSGATLTKQTQQNHLIALRVCLRKAINEGIYPDIDIVEPFITTKGVKRAARNTPSPDLNRDLERLCLTVLTDDDDRTRRLYFLGLMLGGYEVSSLLRLTVSTTDGKTNIFIPDGEPIKHADRIIALLSPFGFDYSTPGPQPLIQMEGTPEQLEARISAKISVLMQKLRIGLYRSQSVFADYLTMAAKTDNGHPEAIGRAVEVRFSGTPGPAFDSMSVANDHGMLIDRWYAMRSVSPKKSGTDIVRQISADKELSKLVADDYAPCDSITIERHGTRVTRNHPAVRNLVFVKTTIASLPKILKSVGNVAAYKTERMKYAAIPYAEIYKMKLILNAFDGEEGLEIFTNEELMSRFSTDDLSIGQEVRVTIPGYEGFTAEVIRCKNRNSYHVEFKDLGFHMVMENVPRAQIEQINKVTA